ncbi:prolactin releasing hormone 2 [Colossoma macropomum]|uniref:prolactin releasing hormone 2 n=1 Tax=Colossoma macropomum TaxID=42526 RepID=UPI001864BCE6|nr:prolactin releasing hormone 2 [Colossoma macropomum]
MSGGGCVHDHPVTQKSADRPLYKPHLRLRLLSEPTQTDQSALLTTAPAPPEQTSTHSPEPTCAMLPETLTFALPCSRSRWGSVVVMVLLILSATATCACCTTVEHDLHIVHNVDNRSPEIDPFWYVGRGVRPIGRFGKRESARSVQPVLGSLELLLSALRSEEGARGVRSSGPALAHDDEDWLP